MTSLIRIAFQSHFRVTPFPANPAPTAANDASDMRIDSNQSAAQPSQQTSSVEPTAAVAQAPSNSNQTALPVKSIRQQLKDELRQAVMNRKRTLDTNFQSHVSRTLSENLADSIADSLADSLAANMQLGESVAVAALGPPSRSNSRTGSRAETATVATTHALNKATDEPTIGGEDRLTRLERLDRLEKLDRLDRLERLDRLDRLERLERLDRLERLEQLDRMSRNELDVEPLSSELRLQDSTRDAALAITQPTPPQSSVSNLVGKSVRSVRTANGRVRALRRQLANIRHTPEMTPEPILMMAAAEDCATVDVPLSCDMSLAPVDRMQSRVDSVDTRLHSSTSNQHVPSRFSSLSFIQTQLFQPFSGNISAASA
jgi:hypothetical protein